MIPRAAFVTLLLLPVFGLLDLLAKWLVWAWLG
jgi:hypothetical protein